MSDWVKFDGGPVLGGEYGTCFDVCLRREEERFLMWVSWLPKQSVALTESVDGIHWSAPEVVLSPELDWEEEINRPSVVKREDGYHLWYTGQVRPHDPNGGSWIGYARSDNGKTWQRVSDRPVLSPEAEWEGVAVMCPHVLWDAESRLWRMWYSAGEQVEPNAIGYATSPDGLVWTRHPQNPILTPDRTLEWEQDRVTGVQVFREGEWHYAFYIGFRDVDTAQIGMARSRDGITGWERNPANPIVRITEGSWDSDACYKPFVLPVGDAWWLWYNGRSGDDEQIGLVIHEGRDLNF